MKIPRFTLLQMLGLMTICGVLFCIAAIDPEGSAIAMGILLLCMLVAALVAGLTYLATRVIAEIAYLVVGSPNTGSPFGAEQPAPQPEAMPSTDLASAVESLQTETQRELGGTVIETLPTEEDRP